MSSTYQILTGSREEMANRLDDYINSGWELKQFGEAGNTENWAFWALLEKRTAVEYSRLRDEQIDWIIKHRARLQRAGATLFYWSFLDGKEWNDQAEGSDDPYIALANAMELSGRVKG